MEEWDNCSLHFSSRPFPWAGQERQEGRPYQLCPWEVKVLGEGQGTRKEELGKTERGGERKRKRNRERENEREREGERGGEGECPSPSLPAKVPFWK